MTPVEYNDTIIKEQAKIIELMFDLVAKIETDLDGCEAVRLKTIVQCDSSIQLVSKMEPFDGDASMRNTALDLFKFYKKAYENEYKEMIEILQLKDKITSDDMARMTSLNDELAKKETSLDSSFQGAQAAFAKKNNIIIEDNKLQKKIDNI
jgi:hypothetical protein